MSKTLKWLQQMGIIWNFHFFRVKNDFLYGFAESVLTAHSRLKLQLQIFFKEVNSNRLLCSKYHPSILTAYSSFPQVKLLVQLKHFCRSGRKLTSSINILTLFFSQYARAVQQPSWDTNNLQWLKPVGCCVRPNHFSQWQISTTFKDDSCITDIAFDPIDILMYFTICFHISWKETLKGIS